MKSCITLLLACVAPLIAEQTQFIFISGGSASGKTTYAKELATRFGVERTLIISVDEYLDKRVQPKEHYLKGVPNFDNPSMVNWELLLSNLSKLQKKQGIDHPIYSFSSWMPEGMEKRPWKPIVIVEGIHAFQNTLDSISGLRIFLSVSQKDRYQRRLARDVKERGYTKEFVDQTFYGMALPCEKIFLNPSAEKADIIIENSDRENAPSCV